MVFCRKPAKDRRVVGFSSTAAHYFGRESSRKGNYRGTPAVVSEFMSVDGRETPRRDYKLYLNTYEYADA